jgi:hypothetical protein
MTGIVRACSSLDFGEHCEYGENSDEPYKTCYVTCIQNGCNGNLSSNILTSNYLLIFCSFLSIFYSISQIVFVF